MNQLNRIKLMIATAHLRNKRGKLRLMDPPGGMGSARRILRKAIRQGSKAAAL